MNDSVLQTIMGALGSVGFALLFRVRGKLLIIAKWEGYIANAHS